MTKITDEELLLLSSICYFHLTGDTSARTTLETKLKGTIVGRDLTEIDLEIKRHLQEALTPVSHFTHFANEVSEVFAPYRKDDSSEV